LGNGCRGHRHDRSGPLRVVRDLFVTPRRRPKLDFRFDSAGTDQVIVGTAGGLDAACVRLRVANEERKDTADDVVAIVRSDAMPLQLDLTPKPAGGQDILDSGSYEISVEIRARNADTIRYAVPVSWDGKWSGKAAMWDHLRVEAPRKFL
jgi:hypothetical protein